MRRFLAPFVFLYAPAIASMGAEAAPAEASSFSPANIRAHVEFLADDLLAGREPCTLGFDIAARYVATRFDGLGLEPAGDGGGWYQRVPLVESSLVDGTARLTVGAHGPARGARLPASRARQWANGTHVIISPSFLEPQLNVEAPVVFAGFGLDAPEHGFDDYRGLDVRGKVVAYLIGAPRGTPSEVGAHLVAEKQRMAEKHGALGVLALETLATRKSFPWVRRLDTDTLAAVTWADAGGNPFVRAPGIRVAAALDETTTLALFEGARVPYGKVLETADRTGARPRGFPLSTRVRVEAHSRLRAFDSLNVLGRIPGTDPRLQGEAVLMMAHLDHVGLRPLERDAGVADGAVDRILNGAEDNAMGVAVMLEVARAMRTAGVRPRRSVVFFATTAEEKGLIGADYFAHRPTVPLERIVAALNLDMPLLTYDFVDVIAFGAEHSTLGARVVVVAQSNGVKLSPDPMPEQGIFTRSDHYALVKRGIPAVFFATGQGGAGKLAWEAFLTKHYHQPSDDITLPFNWSAAARFARINGQLLTDIANADERPAWLRGDFFGDTFARDTSR